MMLGLSKKKIIGLDIGTHSMKMVELAASVSAPHLVSFGIVPLHKDAIFDGQIKNFDLVAAALNDLLKSVRPSSKNIAISISHSSVNIKRITVPQMTNEELDDHIVWEAEQYLPKEMMEDVHLDYNKLEIPSRPGHMEVLIVAAKRSAIKTYTELLGKFGLVSHIVDVDSFALLNAYNFNYQPVYNENIMLLDVGANTTKVVIVRGKSELMVKEFDFGGVEFSRAISNSLGISFEEAETHKLKHTLEKSFPAEFEGIISVVMKDFVFELKKIIDYFYTFNEDAPITHIFVSGGGSKLPNFNSLLQQLTSINTSFLNPFSRIKHEAKSFPDKYIGSIMPIAPVALGLALRQLDEK